MVVRKTLATTLSECLDGAGRPKEHNLPGEGVRDVACQKPVRLCLVSLCLEIGAHAWWDGETVDGSRKRMCGYRGASWESGTNEGKAEERLVQEQE